MPATAVVGLQWGDEGKAKVLDYIASSADIVVRYQGGANAGHTVVTGGERFAFHLVPSGILRDGLTNVIGNGVVLDLCALVAEMEDVKSHGVKVDGRLLVSDRAHVVMPYHVVAEELLGRAKEIGTTRRGIGPCYTDKVARTGLRVVDMYDTEFLKKHVEDRVAEMNSLAERTGSDKRLDASRILSDVSAAAEKLRPFVTDTISFLHRALEEDKRILFEGAQGSLLDIDFGTYPFVTSSNSTAAGIFAGSGVPPGSVDRVVGILKAYTTRVGAGPFPTELTGEIGERLRERGGEYGTTTGRPRRCGWLDIVAARYAAAISGITEIALTKLDVLSGENELSICTAYEVPGGGADKGTETLRTVPASRRMFESAKPVYEHLAGWEEDISGERRFEDMPENARAYVERIEELMGIGISLVGVGPDREANVVRR